MAESNREGRLYHLAISVLRSAQPTKLYRVHQIFGEELVNAIKNKMDIIRTPASSGNIEVLNYLINAMKLCIDVKDHTNWTPLHHSSFNGSATSVVSLLYCGANPKARTAVNRNRPVDIANSPDITAIFHDFDSLTRENFAQKYLPNITNDGLNVDEATQTQNNSVNNTEPFVIMELPVELQTEIYDRLPIVQSYFVKFVSKEWRSLYLERFAKKYPYLGTKWKIRNIEASNLQCRAYPTLYHFLLYHPQAQEGNFKSLASYYDSINRSLEKLTTEDKIYNCTDGTMKFDPREFKRFFFGISRRAETIYLYRLDKWTLTAFVSDNTENFGVAFIFKSMLV